MEELAALARRYGAALVAVAITVALKLLVDGLGEDHPFVLLPVPVAIAAWYGGRGPGYLAAALVALVGVFFLNRSVATSTGDVVALAVVTVEAVLIVVITVGLKDALRRAEASRIAADTAQRELGFAVAVRAARSHGDRGPPHPRPRWVSRLRDAPDPLDRRRRRAADSRDRKLEKSSESEATG